MIFLLISYKLIMDISERLYSHTQEKSKLICVPADVCEKNRAEISHQLLSTSVKIAVYKAILSVFDRFKMGKCFVYLSAVCFFSINYVMSPSDVLFRDVCFCNTL